MDWTHVHGTAPDHSVGEHRCFSNMHLPRCEQLTPEDVEIKSYHMFNNR